MENVIDFRKLVPVANFGDIFILMVHENDVDNSPFRQSDGE